MPAVNTEAINEHLKEISTQVAAGAHAILICDNAGWHQTGRDLKVPDNIALLALSPYWRFPPAGAFPLLAFSPYWRFPLLAGAEPDGERLGVPAHRQALQPGLGELRGNHCRMQSRVGLLDTRPRPHPFNRPARMGMCSCLGGLV